MQSLPDQFSDSSNFTGVFFFNLSKGKPKINCYDRVDQRSFTKISAEKPYFWLQLHYQKYFTKISAEKPYFWLQLQYQKYFTKIIAEKPYFWLQLQYQEYFTKNHEGARHCRKPLGRRSVTFLVKYFQYSGFNQKQGFSAIILVKYFYYCSCYQKQCFLQ